MNFEKSKKKILLNPRKKLQENLACVVKRVIYDMLVASPTSGIPTGISLGFFSAMSSWTFPGICCGILLRNNFE